MFRPVFTGALQIARLDEKELEVRIEQDGLEQIQSQWNTRPNVYYKNLHLYEREFIAGSVAAEKNGKTDCILGASVSLHKEDQVLQETETDGFGDFKFDRLPGESGEYVVRISAEGFESCFATISLGKSANLGVIMMPSV